MIRCMWVTKETSGGLKVWTYEQVLCTKCATRFTRERDGVCWAWCEGHNKRAGHSGGEVEISEQEYVVQSVQNS
jgi:hypothetical protein